MVTVKMLKEMCEELINEGHGDKDILISRDDEGNGFHTLIYGFDTDKESLKAWDDMGVLETRKSVDEIVLLG